MAPRAAVWAATLALAMPVFAAEPGADSTPLLASGAKGASVAKAQALLDRAWFSSGEIDGIFSSNLRRSVVAYQRAHDLPASGKVDAATWSALDAAATPAFVEYTVTAQDTAGPFVKIPKDAMARAELPALGYESVQEALAERFHMSPRLLASMNHGKAFKAGDVLMVANVNQSPSPVGAKAIQIDKSDRMLFVVGANEQVLAAFPVSIGGARDPLPVGRLTIANEVKNPSFTYDPALLKSAKRTDEKVEMRPGPNNPVGNMWLGLSKPHWGIHGTPEPSRLGREETNGCVHMANWDAQRLSLLAKAGTVVDVRP